MTIRQLMLLGVFSVVTTACSTWTGTCNQDSDCGAGGVCDSSCDCCLYPGPFEGASSGDPQPGVIQCVPECGAYQQCMGTTCEARYSALVIEAPSSGATVKKGNVVQVTAKLVLSEGKTPSPPPQLVLSVTPPGGASFEVPLIPMNESYSATFDATEGGVYQLVATWPDANLTSANVELVSDGIAPTFTVAIEPAPARPAPTAGTTWTDSLDPGYATAHRRDEPAFVLVSSEDDDVKTDSVTVELSIGGGAPEVRAVQSISNESCGGSARWCGRAEVELSKPEMNAFHAAFAVTATGMDIVGNSGTSAPSTGRITRFKWMHEADGNPIRGSVAIARKGLVIGGTTSGGSSGELFALTSDGARRWELALGSILASPAVGEGDASQQPVYVAATDTTGAGLWALDVASGTPLTPSVCRINASGSTVEASLALSSTRYDAETAPIETASTVVNGVGRLLSIRPGSTVDWCLPKAGAGDVSYPDAIVAKGTAIYFADTQGALRGYDFDPVDVWRTRFAPVSGLFGARALAIDGDNLVSSRASGVSVTTTSGAPGWTYFTNALGWPGVIGAQSRFYAGLGDNKLLSVTVGNSSSAQSPLFNANGVVQGAPLLGQGGWVYAAGTDGTLVVRREDDFGNDAWSVDGLGAIEASLNIDCGRDSSGSERPGAPGVLYVANTDGELYALIVDSRGIDTTAAWPKYQHDPRNTGNADTPVSEFACD